MFNFEQTSKKVRKSKSHLKKVHRTKSLSQPQQSKTELLVSHTLTKYTELNQPQQSKQK